MSGPTPIIKPLPPREFVDFTDGAHGYNAESRWEALAKTGYLTPNESFFIRSHGPTPHLDAAAWRLRVEGPGVKCPGPTLRGRPAPAPGQPHALARVRWQRACVFRGATR